MEEIYKALGWQGGTVHQIIAEINRLKFESETRRRALDEANRVLEYKTSELSKYAKEFFEQDREIVSLRAELNNRKKVEELAGMNPAELLNLVESARGDKESFAKLSEMVREIGVLVDVSWVGLDSTHSIREAIREFYRLASIADKERTDLRNRADDQWDQIKELNGRIRHAIEALNGELTIPQIDEIRKVRKLEPLSTSQENAEHDHP